MMRVMLGYEKKKKQYRGMYRLQFPWMMTSLSRITALMKGITMQYCTLEYCAVNVGIVQAVLCGNVSQDS